MPRTVSSKVHIALPAPKAWELRNHFGLEKHIAALNKRELTLVEEESIDVGTEHEQRHRVVRCELVGEQHLGGGNMWGIKAADLASDISSSFFVHKFDEEHGTEFYVDMAMKRLNISIAGHQWCLPETDTSCFLCTCVDVEVKLTGIGGLVEMQLERRMRASHVAFPKHALEFLRSNREVSKPATPVVATSQNAGEVQIEVPGPIVQGAVGDASPNWLRLAWAFVASGALRRAISTSWERRHAVLKSKRAGASDTVHVRVGRRHAQILLICGCANTILDADEIVE